MHKIAVIPGDGTGPEVVVEGLKALDAVAAKQGFKYETVEFDFGGERYLRTGEVLPDSAADDFRQFDAIYLGAIGHPDVKPGILEKGILLRLRFELDQYINLRPVKLYPNVPTPIKDKGPEKSTSWWCAKTPRDCTPELAASSRRARPTKSRCRSQSTLVKASSAVCATLLSTPSGATRTTP